MREMHDRNAFTLIELLVVIAIISVLAAILFPVFANARNRADQATCQSNLKQVGMAFEMYCQDNDDRYPPKSNWKSVLLTYVTNLDIYRCPSRDDQSIWNNQGYNIGYPNQATDPTSDRPALQYPGFAEQKACGIVYPGEKILLVEWNCCNAGPPCGPYGFLDAYGSTSYWAVCRIHTNGSNILFGDDHVKWMLPDDYHSNTYAVDDAGNPTTVSGGTVTPVPIDTWRSYWDTSYENE